MSHHAWIHRGWPRPTCPPPARPLRSQPRGRLRTLPRLHSPHRNLTSHCCSCGGGGDIATTAPGSSRPGGSRGGRAEGSSMVMGGGGVRRWFEEALGQRLNLAAAASSFRVVATEEGRRLAIPHVWAPDIRWVDWRELKRLGFRGVVFDKDNTLTAPYSLALWPPISASFADCVAAFPGRLAVFSNSAVTLAFFPYLTIIIAQEKAPFFGISSNSCWSAHPAGEPELALQVGPTAWIQGLCFRWRHWAGKSGRR